MRDEQVGLVELPHTPEVDDRLVPGAVRSLPSGHRVQELDRRAPVDVLGLWQPWFPTPELVSAAADLLPAVVEPAGELAEGPRWEVVVSPGVLRVRTRDYARAGRAYERALRHHQADVDVRAALTVEGQDMADGSPSRGRIVGWSRRSRANLVARLSDLDYTRLYGRYSTCSDCGTDYSAQLERCPACRSPRSISVNRTGRLPAMLTLTYPGDWVTVAPDAETVKRHFWALCKRYERAWGEPLIGPWKMEFQRRGAPHFHVSTTPPMGFVEAYDPDAGRVRQVDFRAWLSITWADVVAHPDPEQRRRHRLAGSGVDYAEGIKLTDPRRMAVYFAKYGTAGGKEYQHQVPGEWCGARLRCDDCGGDYDERGDDPCPGCGSYSAELVELTTGTGRFWGYRGLRPVLAVRQVTPSIGIQAGRIMRRWYRAKGLTTRVTALRIERATGRINPRRRTVRKRLFTHNRGFACVNDAPAFASQLARYLSSLVQPGLPPDAGIVSPEAATGARVQRPTAGPTEAPAAGSASPAGAS